MIRLRTGPAALFGLFLLIALLFFLPLRAALGWVGLDALGLGARRVTGSVWGGTLTEARFGDLALGDLYAHLSPLPLLVGRARIVLDGPEGGSPLHGAIAVSRHGFGVDDMTASIATGRVFAPLPVTRLDLTGVSARFADGQCVAAAGRVRATLGGDAGGIALPQFVSGAARCEGTALLVPLASQAGSESVALRIDAGGRYRADLSLVPADPAAAAKLAAAGFVGGPGGYRLSIEGRF